MKKITSLALAAALAVTTGCATQKQWAATGGSKSDGTIKLSYEFGPFETPQVSETQAVSAATSRCKAWGYESAEAFGGRSTSCSQRGGLGDCLRWMVTKEYQCIDQRKKASTASYLQPATQQSTGKTAYQAEKLAEAIGCDSTLRTISTSPDEVYQVECGNGQIKILSCDLNKCKVAY